MPFGLTNQDFITRIEPLHSDRIKALQTIKTDGGQILNRTFFNYLFTDTIQYRVVKEPPPFWIGVIPDDPSTYENRLPDVDYHFIVRSRFDIEELTGYLMYGQPLENEEEYGIDDEQNLDLAYINPSRINLWQGWFRRITQMWSYDYYVPISVGQKFVFRSSKLSTYDGLDLFEPPEEINGIEDLIALGRFQGVGNFDEGNKDFVATDTYRLRRIPRGGGGRYSSNNYTFFVDVLQPGSIMNFQGFSGSTAKFKFKEDPGLFVEFKIKNCSVWLSSNGITKDVEVYRDTSGGTSWNNSTVSRLVNPSLDFVLIEANTGLRSSSAAYAPKNAFFQSIFGDYTINVKGPPVTGRYSSSVSDTGYGFSVEASGQGRFYFHFKEDLIDIESPTLVSYPEGESADFNDPKPYNTDVGFYEFIPEDERGWTST